ncbi:hypothetical protein H7J50_02020 [Mycobacterium intermedium]|nr:hypothetical protein [Mycobacterium intermedium]MCV6962599.1 hypothetical protein [Mycobacterium intermedium]
MTTVIVVTVLVLLGLGIVTNELLRLRRYLKNSPSGEQPAPPPDEAP